MNPTGMIFDLDGTLVDSLGEIAWAVNEARKSEQLVPLPQADYQPWVGRGLRHLIASMLGDENDPRIDRILKSVRAIYDAHAGERAALYEGIAEMLADLEQRQIPLSVLTNKPDGPAKGLIEQRFAPGTFRYVVGQRDGHPVKPDPAAALRIIDQAGGDPADWWFVGDMTVDIETAMAAGMVAVGVTWGIQSAEHNPQTLLDAGADLLIDHPSELIERIDAASANPARHSI
ncbi:HAD family hydrolase [Mucisphaera calidilacus]|uniref:phosphoglycolate phosphatase n=1 Tax=Mucisphaera calidilacus TaxID=2527982 RepID=A0A518BW71_9BACT|nr:HAD family hydrolase [Mucisphaera calidilacus]QDU71233.1 Phosphoglycolate phosphatase [Mucisphaera calidilacus]